MRFHALQHVPFEGPAGIGDWARARGHQVTTTRLYAGEALPPHDGYDLLAVLGGPMSIHDEAEHPWLVAEKRFLSESLALDRRVVGVCLGAQLIASVLGSSVYRAAEKEIGWFPVQAVALPPDHVWAGLVPREFLAFHWHGETFDLPRGAVHLARTEVCPHQAFLVGRALALQFHVEATEASVRALVEHAAHEIEGGQYQQAPGVIEAVATDRCPSLVPLLASWLDRWAE